MEITLAAIEDAEQILELQKLAYQSEADIYQDWGMPPIKQTIEEIRKEFAGQVFYKAVFENKMVGGIE